MSNSFRIFDAPLKKISLVEASAGTGKTYNITSLYVRSVVEKKLLPAEILVLTYTEAATAELKFRILNRLKESLKVLKEGYSGEDEFLKLLVLQDYKEGTERIQQAIDEFDEAAVFTIHGFCNRLLAENSLFFDISPGFEVLPDEAELLQDCVDDYWRTFIHESSEELHKKIILEYLIDSGFGPDELRTILGEIINRPYARLTPKPEEDFEAMLRRFINKFGEIKQLWQQEGEQLETIFKGDDLNGNIYRKSHEDLYWAQFMEWINSERPKISTFDKLENFGLKISRSGKKEAAIPELGISKAIDEYLELADRLRRLKPAFITASLEKVEEDFTDRKNTRNLLTYNDFLIKVEEGLKNDKPGKLKARLRNQYPVALVDEFQDTDPVQYSIFRQLYQHQENTALFMIGDPKQAIYGFRGADIYTYLQAKEDSDASQRYTLDYNFRSNAPLINAVNYIFNCSENPFLIDDLKFEGVDFPEINKERKKLLYHSGKKCNPLQFILLNDSSELNKSEINELLFESVSNEIAALLGGAYTIGERKVREKDIAVLVRRSFEGEHIQERLREKGINSVLRSKTSVFQSTEAEELFVILNALQNLSYEPGIRSAMATELLGFKVQDILDLLNNDSAWFEKYQHFIELKSTWDTGGIEVLLNDLISRFDIKKRLAQYFNAERRITNLHHLAELLAKAEREERLKGKSLLKWFNRKIKDSPSKKEEEELRLESDEDLVQISTIHASKGLEYPIVFCPFLWDSPKFSDRNSVYRFYREQEVCIDINTGEKNEQREQHQYLDLKEDMAEAARLAYVALTRAENACFVHLPDAKDTEFSSLVSVLKGRDFMDQRAKKKVLKTEVEDEYSFEELADILRKSDQITVRGEQEESSFVLDDEQQTSSLGVSTPETFGRNDIFDYPGIASYSTLARKTGTDGTDHHDFDYDYTSQKPAAGELNRYNFPRGARAGTCLHKIFEDIVFGDEDEVAEKVQKNLEQYGIGRQWRAFTSAWVKEVLSHRLKSNLPGLGLLPGKDILKEMEFHFPVKKLQSTRLWNLIRPGTGDGTGPVEASGFMKGFIDLVFRYKSKYYILDYKSNHLGDDAASYDDQALKTEILNAGYDLQYHIYILALHRFLEFRVKNYDYESHFGGAVYLFLRGVEPDIDGSGVYFDRPDKKVILKMNEYFEKGGVANE